MRKCLLILLFIHSLSSSWADVNSITVDEALLQACATAGGNLQRTCVDNPPKTKEEFAVCVAKKSFYISCLEALTKHGLYNYKGEGGINLEPEVNHRINPFTPCSYTIAHLVLPHICPAD